MTVSCVIGWVQVLPDPNAGPASSHGRQPVRPRRDGQDGVSEGLGCATRALCAGVQLRRVVRLFGHGQAVRGTVSGGWLGCVQASHGSCFVVGIDCCSFGFGG